MKYLLLLLLTFPNYQKIKVIVNTIDHKGKKAPCRVIISKNSVVHLDVQSTGSFSCMVEEGVYKIKTVRCLEDSITWVVDRPKTTVIVIDTDCDNNERGA